MTNALATLPAGTHFNIVLPDGTLSLDGVLQEAVEVRRGDGDNVYETLDGEVTLVVQQEVR